MTPYQLSILINVYSGAPISVDADAPIFNGTLRDLMSEMWISSTANGRWQSTEKLNVFMKHILNLPAPVQAWAMPGQPKEAA